MKWQLLSLCFVVSFVFPTVETSAQSFRGLDLGNSAQKTKKKKRTKKKKATPAPKESVKRIEAPPEEEDRPRAEKPPQSSKPPPTMTFGAMDVSGKTGERQKMDAAVNLFKEEQYAQSALASYELMNDPKYAGLLLEAQYNLAKNLYRMGMYHSSLGQFSKILEKGPNNNRFFKSSLEWLFFISRKTVNEQVILDEIARYANAEFPEKFQSEFRYLLGRYYLVRGRALDQIGQTSEADGSFAEVRRLAMLIPKGDAFYARARYLEGLTLFREDKLPQALEVMKTVVRETRTLSGPMTTEMKAIRALRELAFMQLARTHYGARQNRNALYYYGKIERGSPQWLESLFEASWANYRVGQYEQALGNLITLSSPFFRDEYFPEALILKAVIYYENCRYAEALAILEDFERIYGPVAQQLEALVQKDMDASEYYNVLADVQKRAAEGEVLSNSDIVLGRVLNLALTDKDLKKTNESILELEAEIEAFSDQEDEFKFSNLAKDLMEALKGQREGLAKKAGIMAKGKLVFEMGQLKQFLANGLRIKFETTSKEKEFLEEQLKAGGQTEWVRRYKYSVAVSDDQLYWPYSGEYWRDELGTYQYTLTRGCIDTSTQRAGVAAAK